MGCQAKGHRLLAEINLVRAAVDLEPLGQLALPEGYCACGECAIRAFAGCGFGVGLRPEWDKKLTLKFFDEDTTSVVAAALGQPHDTSNCEVLATDAMDSYRVAAFYRLVIYDRRILRAWIEPTNDDPAVWDLHLMPGEIYPPGHTPHGYKALI